MKNTLELIEQLRFAELKKISVLSKAQESFLNSIQEGKEASS